MIVRMKMTTSSMPMESSLMFVTSLRSKSLLCYTESPMKQKPKGACDRGVCFMGLLGVAGPEAESAHSEWRRRVLRTWSTRLWGARTEQKEHRIVAEPPIP